VPIAEKDKLYKEFRDTINKHFDKLKVSAREAQETMYRERLKNVSGGDMGKFVSEEKRELQDKIQKLTDKYTGIIDKSVADKEKEVMTV
jgi:ribosome recycling factor